MTARSHNYQPTRKINPNVLSKKIEILGEKIDTLKKNLKSVIMANNTHMAHIANFARHDLGNAVQTISAIASLIEKDISTDDADSLKAAVSHLDTTLHNLGEIINPDLEKTFTIPQLMKSVNVFVRTYLSAHGISISCVCDEQDTTPIHQPFHTTLQLIHNLVINAKKALANVEEKRIEIEANITDGWCVIAVKDTGCGITDENLPNIFNFGFTTTDGSGIGLFHATSVCREFGGTISVTRNREGYSTIFTIKFPVDGNKTDSCD